MRYLAPILFALALGAAASAPADAQPNRAREGVQSGDMRSLGEILNGIRRERPGNLADVQGPNMGPQGEPHYRLKWLTPDGRVLFLDTDARTGRVLGVEGDDRRPGPGAPRGPFAPRGNFGAPPQGYEPPGPNYGPPRGDGGFARPPDQGFGRAPGGPYGRAPQGFDRGPGEFQRGPPNGPENTPRGPFGRGGGFERGPQ